ncbi:MAG: MEDS domain-containing protein [Streptosporangiaceae bacterium]
MTGPQSLTIMNRLVPSGTHICAFYSGPAGRDHVVMPFLADGIRAGQKCICVLESLAPADVLVKLDRQVDLDRTVQSGQLELATPADAYLRSGTFSTDAMLSYWQHAAAAARGAKGSGMLRATGEMPSVLDHPDGRTEFFRYEARLNGCIASLPAVILCLYDLQRFGAEVLMDTLRTHPMVVVDDMVHDNPYYVDPGEFLRGRE